MRKLIKFSLLLFLGLSLVSFLGAQGKLTGSINGKVVDTEGNPLPGVTVTVEGPALQGKMSFVTTETGSFRFPALPPVQITRLRLNFPALRPSSEKD